MQASTAAPPSTAIRMPSKAAPKLPRGALATHMLGAVFLQRIGLNASIGGVLYPFPLSMVTTPLVTAWLVMTGWAKLAPVRLMLYLLVIVAAGMSFLTNLGAASPMSMFLLMFLYSMYLFPISLDQKAYLAFFRTVANVCSAICVLGALTYVLQYVIQSSLWFTWRDVVPPQYLIEFNTLNYFAWGGTIFKGNGFFLMEASWQSQLAAKALLIATIILKDWRYVIPCGLGLLTAFSGTGYILFVLFGLIPLLLLMFRSRVSQIALIFGLLSIPVLVTVYWEHLNFSYLIARLSELSNPNTSGFTRFVGSQQVVEGFLQNGPVKILFGAGAGAQDDYVRGLAGDGFLPGYAKLIIEYGLFGLLTFGAFMFYCFRQTTGSAWLALAFVFQYLYLDGSLVIPQQAFLTLWISAMVILDKSKGST